MVMVVGIDEKGSNGGIMAGLGRLKNPSSRVTIDAGIGLGM